MSVAPFVRFAAPYPTIQTISKFPNPEFSDSERNTSTVNYIRTEDGTLYSYVKKKGGRRRLQMQFTLTREKALELRGFVDSYYASVIHLTDVEEQVWLGYIMTNPNEFETVGGNAAGGELQVITLDFEGHKQ